VSIVLASAAALAPSASIVASPAAAPPTVAGCPLLPPDNVWNARVDTLPVHPSSAAYLSSIGLSGGLKADFGAGSWNGGPIGIPFVAVAGTQPRVPVRFTYADESEPGPYPIPPSAPVEGGPNASGDRHVLVVDRDNCVLYELWSAYPQPDGSWSAGSGAVFPLTSNALRPAGWTSADAAGLPVLPGLVRYDEVAAGEIAHALRFTAQVTQRAYVWPARHYASSNTSPSVPPMGIRVRLKAGYDVSRFSPRNQVILQALKTYGMFLADNGSNWYVSGVPDSRWDDNDLRALGSVSGSSFEVVDDSVLMVNSGSGQARGGLPPPTATPTAAVSATATPTAGAPPTATRTATPVASRTPTQAPTQVPTATRTRTPTAVPTTAASPSATPSGQPLESLTLQGTAALTDTWISPDYPTTSFGSTAQAHLQGRYTPDRLLFQPSLDGLPAGAQVERATLQVYAYSSNSSGDTLAAHQLLTPWTASAATYRSPWSAPGLQAGTDYVAAPVGTATVGGSGWLTVDVTAVVQSWQGGAPNRGLMLRLSAGQPNAHYRVDLAEYTSAALRPKLTVSYR
jgi:hypothetical protein